MINPSIIEDLGEDIFRQALVIFLKNCENDIQSLNQSFLTSNFKEVEALSHKLTGTFGSMRVEKIPNLLREINEEASASNLKIETFEKVKELYIDLKIYIKDNFSIETQS